MSSTDARTNASWWSRLTAWLPRGGSLDDAAWRVRHQGIVALAWLHVPVLAAAAVWHAAGPVSWAGIAVVAGLALAAGRDVGSHVRRASLATLSLLTSTALLIHLFGGLIELHFHFFVVIAVVAMYQSWTPYLLAIGYVLAHHVVMGLFMPMHVYNHPAAMAHPVLFALVHAGFVLAESVACLAYWKITEQALDRERDQRTRAERTSEALALAHRELHDLMAMVSHDFRTPLTVVNGHAELVLEAWDDLDEESRRDLVGRVRTAGTSLEEMLAGTLTLMALDGDGLHPRPGVLRLDQHVRTTLSGLADPLHGVDLSGLEPVLAVADRQQLVQVVSNLVTNAAKYGAAPYVVTTRGVDDVVELTISDSGPGVPADFVPRMFDRYSRAESVRGGDTRGTGLGLYLVRRLLETNNGSIGYVARPGGGSTFVVRLPRGPRLLHGSADAAPAPALAEPGATTA